MIKPIPTTYKGIEFRSKLEANVAQLFDACEMPWAYEQEGYDIDGTWYLPDFWLPQAKQFVEVKGAIEDPSVEKCIKLAWRVREGIRHDEDEAGQPAAVVVLSQPFIQTYIGERNEVFGFGFNGVEKVDAVLVTCPSCKAAFFMTWEGVWNCSACGEYMAGSETYVCVYAEHRRGVTRYTRA